MSGAQFWRITVVRGSTDLSVVRGSPDPAQLVLCLRRWPVEHPSPQRLTFIHAVLQHAARRGISFIPVPITTHEGESFVHHAGHLWQLEPWMPGAADYEQSPRAEKLRSAMVALAHLHNTIRDFGATPIRGGRMVEAPDSPQSAVSRRLAQLRELSQQGTTVLSRALDDAIWPDLAPLARQFIALLPAALSSAIAKLEPLAGAGLPLQPCLRDVWHDHILFTGDKVTGIIDFGAIDIDTPSTDIARLLGSLVGDDAGGWQTGLAAYSAVRALSPEEPLAVLALDRSGTILAGCNWVRWIYVERRQFENRQQVIGRFRMIVCRCSAAQRR